MKEYSYSELQTYSMRLSSAWVNSIRLGNQKQAQLFYDRWIEVDKEINKRTRVSRLK